MKVNRFGVQIPEILILLFLLSGLITPVGLAGLYAHRIITTGQIDYKKP
jgi:hypothetical protein